MQFICLRRSTRNACFASGVGSAVFSYVVNSGMLLTSEHVVTQLQQEVFTVNAQVADQSGLADAVRVINNRIWQRKRIITSTRLLFQVW